MADAPRLPGVPDYARAPGRIGRSKDTAVAPSGSGRRSVQLEETGISWTVDAEAFATIAGNGIERARHRFRGSIPSLIWNAAALEGNTFTLPEVQTLLDGVSIGGRAIREEQQILALSEAYSLVDELVGAGRFTEAKTTSDLIHGIVAEHEAIESGHFRGEGRIMGGGSVSLANGGSVEGFPEGPGGVALRERFDSLLSFLATLSDPRERALVYFAAATRTQFYFDGNKRTARLMMTGMLMSAGFDAINIPFARKFEFNLALDELFSTDDATKLISFIIDCAAD